MNITRRRLLGATAPLGLLTACGGGAKGPRTALVGATLLDGLGGEPLADAVVVVEGDRIRSVGSRTGTAVPVGAATVDLTGKFLIPSLVDVMPERFVEPRYSLKEFNEEMNGGEPIVFGVPSDSPFVPADVLSRLRTSGLAVAPMMARLSDTGRLELAKVNLKTLLESGVTVAAASGDRSYEGLVREVLAMARCGAETRDILSAATRGGAAALRDKKRTGTIRAGSPADLLVLAGDPLADLSMLHRVERTMRGGVWKEGS